jgi:hypothetical protein
MRKSLFLAGLVMMVMATPVLAGPQAAQLAIGTTSASWTPVGIRYWASPQVGIDAEVGFWKLDPATDSGEKSSEVDLQIGIPINIWECSDVWVHFRPFFLLSAESFEDFGGQSVDGNTNFYFGAQLEAEFWLLECLSFSVWHGLVVESLDEGAGDTTTFHLEGASLGEAGFHWYL